MENPNFLKNKYNLHNAPEVESAAKRTEARSRLRPAAASQAGEKVPEDPAERIQNYLERFTEIIERKEPAKRERGIEVLKEVLHKKFVIKSEEIPEGYFENQRRLAREQGHGDVEITDELRKQLKEVIITDQKSTLDNWIDYLSSKDATYPDWLKYYAFRNVINLGEYDKEKKQFAKRSKGTVKPFPDLNREALAYVLDAIEKKYEGKIPSEQDPEFKKYLQGENFAKLYAFAINKVTPAQESALVNTAGEWVKYRQGVDHMPLVESLQGHGTGWCTAGESTARAQLEAGDFYVYYSYDKNKKPNIPRAAIRMQEDQIAEVRGISHEQNLDPYMNDIVKAKLSEFPDGKTYEKKTNDMKYLTEIEKQVKAGQKLTKDDLIFLYEIDSKIEGFGYQRDPRIEEIRKGRKPKEDAPIVFECKPEEVAHSKEEIAEKTKAYVGELVPGIFDVLSERVKHVYTSFPEGKISQFEADLGGESEKEIISELEKREKSERSGKIYVSDYTKSMLKNKDFFTLKNKERAGFVKLKVRDLGFPNGATTDEIYQAAERLGFDLCPPETGPRLRLDYEKIFKQEQPIGEYLYIAMKQIADSGGYPNVFYVYRRDGGKSWLAIRWARPTYRWLADGEFVFRPRKPLKS